MSPQSNLSHEPAKPHFRFVCRSVVAELLRIGALFSLGVCAQLLAAAAPSLSIQELPGGQVQIAWPSDAASFSLEQADSLISPVPWRAVSDTVVNAGGRFLVLVQPSIQTRFYRLRAGAASAATIIQTSPASGESGVSVTRETVFRLSDPLAPSAMITTERLYAEFGARRLLSRVALSGDRKTVTLFYLENLPGSARIRVTFNGGGIKDATGADLDADDDGQPGGTRVLEFETAGLVGLPNTGVMGHVYASEKGPSGANRPLRNVTVTVDGAEESLRTITDASGFFRLQPAPAGRFFVHVDGRTAVGSEWPGGAYYPFVGKAWEATPGRTNNLANGTGEIFLPLIPSDALQAVSATAETRITFSQAMIAANPALAGVEVRVPPDALFSDNGTRGGKVGIAPVPPDRLPEPLPPGLDLPLVITIQTDGPMNFDRPVPVRFPNLPDPTTGQILPPGAKSALWSFNHDTGRWEIQGPMTITADGLYVESDPGVGVRQPGWHGVRDGSQGNNDDEPYDDDWNDHDNDETDDNDPDDLDPCKKQRDRWDSTMADCLFSASSMPLKAFIPVIGCAVSIGQAFGFGGNECEDFIERCEKTIITQAVSAILGCVPGAGGIASAAWICLLDANSAESAYNFCKSRHPGLSSLQAPPLDFPVENPADIPYRNLLEQAQLFADAATLYAQVLGDAKWTVVIPPDEWPESNLIFQTLQQSMDAASAGGERILQIERNLILSLDRPANITEADLLALIDRFDKIMAGTLPPQEFNVAAIKAAATKLQGTALELQSRGWETVYDGLIRDLAEASEDEDASLGGGVGGGGQAALAAPRRPTQTSSNRQGGLVRAPLYYRLKNMFGGFVRRGQLSSQGTLDSLIVAADTLYSMEYFDPVSTQKGRSFFVSGPNGSRFKLPRFILVASDPKDTDGDGLPDDGEGIIGTNPALRDTDGDGVNDGAEIQSGTNPLDGLPAATGLIASVDTPGTAVDVCAFDDIVAVADSEPGVSIFNISNPTSPVLVATVPTPDAATAVAGEGNLLVAAVGGQLAIIDISNPLTAHVIQMIPVKGRAQTVATGGGLAYAGTSKGRVYVIDLTNGVILEEITLPGSAVGDLALANGKLYVLTQNALVVYGSVGHRLQPLGTVGVSGEPVNDRRRLFVGGGHAYVGYFTGFSIIDVNDATSPRLVGSPPAIQLAVHDIVANGSGLVVNSTSFRGEGSLDVSLYDVSDPTDVTRFLTTIETPGFGRGLVLYNGLAFVASGPAGLEVINYLPYDGQGRPPSITLAADFPLNRPEVEQGKFLRLTARVADDVQVGRVEFYSNGVRVRTDGNFPFEHQLLAPLVSQTNSLRIRARAIDTGGNATWSDDVVVAVEQYLKVIGTSPATNVLVAAASVSTVTATFSEPINLATLNTDSYRLFEAGPDGMHGTADDLLMSGGVISWQEELRTASLAFPTLLGAGSYRATLSTGVTDRAGNRLATEHAWTFAVRTPVLWNVDSNGFWDELAKWSTSSVPTSNDVVVIDRPTDDYTVTVRRNQTVLNLSSQEALALTGGTLSILGSAEINNAFSIYGGSVEFNGPVLDAGSILTITNGLAKFNHTQVAVPGVLFVSGSVGRGGRVDFNHDGAVTPSSLHLAESGTIGGSGLVAPIGPVVWDGGTMTGLGVTRFQGSSEIKGAGTKAIREERIVENAGRCVWTGSGNIQFEPDAAFINLPGATFDAQNDQTFIRFGLTGGAFRNLGTFIKSAGTGATRFNIHFSNQGTTRVQSGRLVLGGSSEHEGPVILDPGAALEIMSSPNVFSARSSVSGSGTVLFGSGTGTDFAGAYSVGDTEITGAIANFNADASSTNLLLSGTLGGTGLFRSLGQCVWTNNGILRDGGIFRTEGTLRITGNGTKELRGGRTFENAGAAVWTGSGQIAIREDARFSNLPGASFDVQTDSGIFGSIGASPVFINGGDFRKTSGQGTTSIAIPFANSGTVEPQSGTIRFGEGYIQTAGVTRLAGGQISAPENRTFEIQAGLLTGSGTVTAIVTNAATVSPGASAGVLNIVGNYTQTTTGILQIEINGPLPQTSHDQITVTGQAVLAGTLEIALAANYDPPLGQEFTILTANRVEGSFANVPPGSLVGGKRLEVIYDNTSVKCRVLSP